MPSVYVYFSGDNATSMWSSVLSTAASNFHTEYSQDPTTGMPDSTWAGAAAADHAVEGTVDASGTFTAPGDWPGTADNVYLEVYSGIDTPDDDTNTYNGRIRITAGGTWTSSVTWAATNAGTVTVDGYNLLEYTSLQGASISNGDAIQVEWSKTNTKSMGADGDGFLYACRVRIDYTADTGQTINANSVADTASVSNPQIQNLLSIVQADSVADAASVPSPQVVPGVGTIQADSVADSASVPSPEIKSILMVYPGSIADTASVSDPQVVPGTATIQADSVADAASVSDPSVVPGVGTISADSVPDTASVSDPQVVPGQVQIQADPVADSAAVGQPTVNDLGGGPSITSVSLDDVLYRSETNWAIAGSGFGATQGGSKVFLNTANDKDGNEVEQTVQSWSNTEIVVSSVTTGSLGAFAPAYVLVEIA